MGTEIKFVTRRNAARWGSRKGDCVASIEHNAKLDIDSMAADMAASGRIAENEARYYCGMVRDYVVQAISEGKRLDFGAFSLKLGIKGTFAGANAPFDPEKNAVTLSLGLGAEMRKALESLRPVNATAGDRPAIQDLRCASVNKAMVLRMGEKILVSGDNLLLDTRRDDEGVWLKDADGERRLARDTVTSCTRTTLDCVFDGGEAIEPGQYRIIVATRSGDVSRSMPATAHRKVEVA